MPHSGDRRDQWVTKPTYWCSHRLHVVHTKHICYTRFLSLYPMTWFETLYFDRKTGKGHPPGFEAIQITHSITHTNTKEGQEECKLHIQQEEQRYSCVTSNEAPLTPVLRCWFALITMAWSRQQRCAEMVFHPLIRSSDSLESVFQTPSIS